MIFLLTSLVYYANYSFKEFQMFQVMKEIPFRWGLYLMFLARAATSEFRESAEKISQMMVS